MSEATIRIDVRLFAALRERAGTGRTTLELPEGATAGEARDALWPALGMASPLPDRAVALAVNQEYARPDVVLGDGDELALIPPVSGGAPEADDLHAAVVAGPIDQAALHARVARRAAGAIVTFSGTPRDVPQLDYEAHEEMARARMAAILADVAAKHGACAVAAEHRVGPVPWPEAAVVVAVSAPHRGEAFDAAREALDRIKADAPIWKQEVEGDRREWVAGTVPSPADAGKGVGASGEAGERHPGGALPHLRPDGGATMVDVGGKQVTERRAVAAALLSTTPETAELIRRGDLPKGDVLGVARIAGITAAKRVPDLVPLAHPLPLTKVDVRAQVAPAAGQVRIEAEARTVGKTGVEIEAMTAALVAAINVYDMVKGVERGIAVGPVALVAKSGGRTGDFAGPAPWEPGFRGRGAAGAATTDAGAGAVHGHEAPPAARAASAGHAALAAADATAVAAVTSEGAGLAPTAGPTSATDGAASPAHARPGARDAARPLDPPVAVGLVTVSTSRAEGPPDDPGTVALRDLAAGLGTRVAAETRVRDDRAAVAAAIARLADEEGCDLVLTAGGTGCTVDDVTPEATLDACDRPVPGIAEALRLESREHTHAWPLSRGVAAIRGRTLVVNLPGTPKAAAEALPVLAPVLTHAVRLLRR
ncbi:cyclic pyranopterin monophosphate synthase MoaC [Patulibacter sp. SYSU D01012]|uniref:cyclic pyranopterin monophosphate synthase MoaC n=1 Tax=Patulibacter sp. SYSU D01012 TaxID=2817381 RepID=UPI001B3060CF|nr:cyclic pyranopterin monophosphate synthase MoaC [Patulibacter sp. SYSU D01012]